MGFVTAALFVRQKFVINQKAGATEISDAIRMSFRRMIEHNEWLDNESRKNILQKVTKQTFGQRMCGFH